MVAANFLIFYLGAHLVSCGKTCGLFKVYPAVAEFYAETLLMLPQTCFRINFIRALFENFYRLFKCKIGIYAEYNAEETGNNRRSRRSSAEKTGVVAAC